MLIDLILKILTFAFVLCAVLSALSFAGHGKFTALIKDNIKSSNYVAVMGFLLAFYVIFAILIAILTDDIKDKIILLLFALSPFIIGRFASYERKKYFTIIQVVCILLGAIYAFLIL